MLTNRKRDQVVVLTYASTEQIFGDRALPVEVEYEQSLRRLWSRGCIFYWKQNATGSVRHNSSYVLGLSACLYVGAESMHPFRIPWVFDNIFANLMYDETEACVWVMSFHVQLSAIREVLYVRHVRTVDDNQGLFEG